MEELIKTYTLCRSKVILMKFGRPQREMQLSALDLIKSELTQYNVFRDNRSLESTNMAYLKEQIEILYESGIKSESITLEEYMSLGSPEKINIKIKIERKNDSK